MEDAVKRLVCVTYDKKAKRYGAPFQFESAEDAIRAFGDALRQADTPMARHPEDYQMLHLADYDFVHGVMVGVVDRVVLCDGLDFRSE